MLESHIVQTLVEKYLIEAKEDYIGFWQVTADVEESSIPRQDVPRVVYSIVVALKAKGMVAGDLVKGIGFRPWPENNVESILQRLRLEWEDLGRHPVDDQIAWFLLPD